MKNLRLSFNKGQKCSFQPLNANPRQSLSFKFHLPSRTMIMRPSRSSLSSSQTRQYSREVRKTTKTMSFTRFNYMHCPRNIPIIQKRKLTTQTTLPNSRLSVAQIGKQHKQFFPLIEKHEVVHPISLQSPLSDRVSAPGKRMYGIFLKEDDHAAFSLTPDTPPDSLLGFISASFSKKYPNKMEDIWKEGSIPLANCTFYSINTIKRPHCHFETPVGRTLISQTKKQLIEEFRGKITSFTTLSPMVDFWRWMQAIPVDEGITMITAGDKMLISNWAAVNKFDFTEAENTFDLLRQCLAPRDGVSPMVASPALHPVIQAALLRMGLQYLINSPVQNEKRGTTVCLDPVAEFHLSNGAEVYNLNFAADLSPHRVAQSLGMMVNYRYPLSDIELEENARKYAETREPTLHNNVLAFF